ncbi:hypothetical protein PM082_022699 [Marasmius tenuissimus]|nr:hypothetical protein PM082_022699 [Marasmius tenuissimus]
MNIPPIGASHADFLVLIEQSFSSAAFLLDEVWEVYRDISLLNPARRGRDRYPSGPTMASFAQQLHSHSLAISPECKLSWQKLDQMRRELMLPTEGSTSQPISPTSPSLPLPALSLLMPVINGPMSPSGPTVVQEPSMSTQLPASTSSIPLTIPHSACLGMSGLTLKGAIEFRKSSLSIAHLISWGLYDPYNICTVGGIFSASMFWACFYDTEALRTLDHTFFFESLFEWLEFQAAVNRDDDFWCNKRAYGTTAGRTPLNTSGLWEGAQHLHRYLFEGERLTFRGVFEFMWLGKNADKKKMFPSFGKLSAYLLTVNLVYAGVLASPTVEEMGGIVTTLNKGMVTFL